MKRQTTFKDLQLLDSQTFRTLGLPQLQYLSTGDCLDLMPVLGGTFSSV